RGAAADPAAVGARNLAGDVRAWSAGVAAQTGSRCIWLVGHSEGVLVAELAAQGNSSVCGVIGLAGPGRKFGDIVKAQLRSNAGNAPILAAAFAVIDQLEQGRTVDVSQMHPAIQAVFSPRSQPPWIELFALHPLAF